MSDGLFKHENYCTLLEFGGDDADILTRPLFNVNMRLFRQSPPYRGLIQAASRYIMWCAQTKKKGYPEPKGYSGANAGIPWNIIGLADGTIMINPVITHQSAATRVVKSNCGSLLLSEPILVKRHNTVTVEYYDSEGEKRRVHGFLPTVQHEIDHNLGILIIDRRAEKTDEVQLEDVMSV